MLAEEVLQAAALQLASRGSGELRHDMHMRGHCSADEALPAVLHKLLADSGMQYPAAAAAAAVKLYKGMQPAGHGPCDLKPHLANLQADIATAPIVCLC